MLKIFCRQTSTFTRNRFASTMGRLATTKTFAIYLAELTSALLIVSSGIRHLADNFVTVSSANYPKAKVQIYRSSSVASNETFKCITARLVDLTFPICVYNADEDTYVSGWLARGVYYERMHDTSCVEYLTQTRGIPVLVLHSNLMKNSASFAVIGDIFSTSAVGILFGPLHTR